LRTIVTANVSHFAIKGQKKKIEPRESFVAKTLQTKEFTILGTIQESHRSTGKKRLVTVSAGQ
jgi:hypothetical protein